MSHADDGQLNALLDGELSEREARAVESHVAQCAECRRRLEEARAFLQEAGALLESLGGAAAPRASLSAAAPAAPPLAQPPRSVPKTAKEVAIEIDGRTAKTPAIRPVFPEEVPPAARPRRGWDLEMLAWAASIVLALGVGYLANESWHMRAELDSRASRLATQPQAASETRIAPTAGPNRGAPAASPRATPAHVGGAGSRSDVASRAARLDKPRSGRVKNPAGRTTPVERGALAEATARDRQGAQAPAAQARPTEVADLASAKAAQGAGGAPAPAAVAPSAPPSPAGAGASGFARSAAPAPTAAARNLLSNRTAAVDAVFPSSPGFQRITMEEAARRLSGSIRQIDNMTLRGLEAAIGRLVSGADPGRDVVRLTYTDQLGRRFLLDQQLAEPRQGPAFSGIMPGDTLTTITPQGDARVRWMDGKFWLSLTGAAPVDEVKAAVARVR